jgi:hypothetical protein
MEKEQAIKLANALNGDYWHSGGGIWLVTLHHESGTCTVFSGEIIAQYKSNEAFENGEDPMQVIDLT